jgi:hypothetical protein
MTTLYKTSKAIISKDIIQNSYPGMHVHPEVNSATQCIVTLLSFFTFIQNVIWVNQYFTYIFFGPYQEEAISINSMAAFLHYCNIYHALFHVLLKYVFLLKFLIIFT